MSQTSLDLGVTNYDDSNDSDTQCTPKWLADMLPVVDLDPCSNARSHIKARRSIALPNDGLSVPWHKIATSVWCNPPYSNPLPWAMAGNDAFVGSDVEQLWLVKLDPTTRWWAMLAPFAHVFLCRDRIAFEKNGVERKGTNFCTAFMWLKPHRSKPSVFAECVAHLERMGVIWFKGDPL